MKLQSRRTKQKVAVGYLLLIGLLAYAVYFISKEMESLAEPETYEMELDAKRKRMRAVLVKLYEAEVIGQSVSTGRISDYPSYHLTMKKAVTGIDSLRQLTGDSLQRQRLDSISSLLVRKEQNMFLLLRAVNDTTLDAAYMQQVNLIIEQRDSVVHQERVQTKVKVHQNSYQVQKKRKGFFKRLAEAFSPGKMDTATVTHTAHEYVTDTLTQDYNPGDTVTDILRNIQLELVNKQQKRSDMLRKRSNRLRADGNILTAKINRQLQVFEQEEEAQYLAKRQQLRRIRSESVRTVGGLAIGSVILAVVFLIFIWRDITRSNRYRRELEDAKRRAENLLVARERLMLTITHDLKAPAGAIIGYADLLDYLLSDGRQRDYLNSIKTSAQHLLKLVDALLDYYKLDSNKMEITCVSFRPGQLFDEIYTCFEPLAVQKGLSLRVDVESELRTASFVGAPFAIRQIIDNLLSNAIKFTSEGEIDLLATYEQGKLQLVVRDTGKGIPSEGLDSMFQEFTRLSNAQGEEGFGLGLSIVRKWVDLLKGEMKVYSRVGEGTRFLLRLPLKLASGDAEKMESKTVEPQLPQLNNAIAGLRVLVVDDDLLQLKLISAMLHRLGAEVVVTEQTDLLLRLLNETPFDVLLTDVQIPGMDGFQLLEQVRKSGKSQLPLIAMTARTDIREEDFLEKGFKACLHKPFTIGQLLQTLGSVTGRKKENVAEGAVATSDSELHLEALTAFSADDKAAATEILRSFMEDIRSGLQELDEALVAKDAVAISALAHKLLPLQRMVNAKTCVAALQWLEEQRNEPFSVEMEEYTCKAVDALREVLEKVRKQVESC